MLRVLLIRGMLVGAIAGLLAFGMAKVFGEPQVDRAIAFETQMDEAKKTEEAKAAQAAVSTAPATTTNQSTAAGSAPAGAASAMPGMDSGADVELVSRPVQSTWGLLTAVFVYGTAVGGIFALVYAFAWGRVRGLSPRGLAALLALAAFVVIVVVPGLKYPANPPAVGEPETINIRTELFVSMILISVVACIAAIQLFRALISTQGAWNAALASGVVYIVIIAIAQLLLPRIQEVPENFPAVVLWNFRIAHWGIHVVLWGTIGLLFGYLTERSLTHNGPLKRVN